MKAIERRFERLQATWNQFVGESDEREAQQYLDAGADPAKDWQEWPEALLGLLATMGKDPSDIAESLTAVLARRQDANVIKIVWLDRMPAPWEEQPLVALQPGMIDLLRPDEPRVTTMPMTPEARRKFGDDPPTLVVSYTDKTPHNAPTPAQGASMPVTAPERHPELGQPTAQPQESWEVRKDRYQREMQEQQRRERRSGHSLAAIHRRQREEQQKRR